MGKGKKPKTDPASQSENTDDDASLIDGILGENEDPEDPSNTTESDDNSDNGDTDPTSNTTEDEDGEDGEDAGNQTEDEEDDDDNADDETGNESIADLKRLLKESEDREAELQKKLDVAEADNLSLSSDVTEEKSKADAIQTKLDEATTTISTLEDEKKTFEEQNIKLARFARKALAERVVDLRIMHGKDKPEDRETALSEWANSSSKVLETTIADLVKTPRTIARVNSPGYVVDNNDVSDEDGDLVAGGTAKESKKMTLADFENSLVESMSREHY